MSNAGYTKLTLGLLGVWFTGAITASQLHAFRTGPNSPPLALGIAVLLPITAFLLSLWLSTGFRQFAFSLNPGALTFVQTWRVDGFTFLALYAVGALPGVFALPAGCGDIAIGLTAPLVGWKLARSKYQSSFIAWQMLGILDLVTAIATGALTRFINPGAGATDVMTALPMSLIPTFFVPLFAVMHLICIAQALRWKEPRNAQYGEPVPVSA
jgi:hypothetical protein